MYLYLFIYFFFLRTKTIIDVIICFALRLYLLCFVDRYRIRPIKAFPQFPDIRGCWLYVMRSVLSVYRFSVKKNKCNQFIIVQKTYMYNYNDIYAWLSFTAARIVLKNAFKIYFLFLMNIKLKKKNSYLGTVYIMEKMLLKRHRY